MLSCFNYQNTTVVPEFSASDVERRLCDSGEVDLNAGSMRGLTVAMPSARLRGQLAETLTRTSDSRRDAIVVSTSFTRRYNSLSRSTPICRSMPVKTYTSKTSLLFIFCKRLPNETAREQSYSPADFLQQMRHMWIIQGGSIKTALLCKVYFAFVLCAQFLCNLGFNLYYHISAVMKLPTLYLQMSVKGLLRI